jgi:hypothetical protein
VTDEINSPKHYSFADVPFEVIDVIEAYTPHDFRLANVLKYVCRCEYKGHKLKDLKKAQWYLNRVIEKLEAAETVTDDEAEESERDAYGRVLRASEPITVDPEGDTWVVPAGERVPGSNGDSHRDYYNYDPEEVIARCSVCNEAIRREDLYLTDAVGDYCSTACKEHYIQYK